MNSVIKKETEPTVEIEEMERATIYMQGSFGGSYRAIQVRKLSVSIQPYAQYPEAVWMEYVPKGKRKVRRSILSYKPTGLVAEGWTCPPLPSYKTQSVTQYEQGTVTVITDEDNLTQFDPGHHQRFHDWLLKQQEEDALKVVADYRNLEDLMIDGHFEEQRR
jgi:hypothetical protein